MAQQGGEEIPGVPHKIALKKKTPQFGRLFSLWYPPFLELKREGVLGIDRSRVFSRLLFFLLRFVYAH